MQLQVSETSKAGFEAACQKLNITTDLPEVGKLRPDLGLYLTAHYMLAVIKEAEKDGEIYDITNHDKRKYEPIHCAPNGYKPGSGAGFSFYVNVCALDHTFVGARLASNSGEACRENSEKYSDLWEIIMLDFR